MNIKGLSAVTLEKLMENGWIKNFADLYHLDRYKEDIENTASFGPVVYRNIMESVADSRVCNLEKFLVAITPVFVVDEAHLLSMESLRQLHLLTLPNLNSEITVPIVLCGQESLFEKLNYPACKPVLSRVMDGFNLKSMSNEECNQYIMHQICNIGGGSDDIFDDLSLKAIYGT